MKYTDKQHARSAMLSIGKEAAIALYDSGWWKELDHCDIARRQMFTAELCCPFGVFHEALEKTLGRPVFTHELGFNPHGLMNELMGEQGPPTFEEIIALIPEEKRVLVVTE